MNVQGTGSSHVRVVDYLLRFPSCLQGAGLEVERPGLEPALIGNYGILGRSFTHHGTVSPLPAPLHPIVAPFLCIQSLQPARTLSKFSCISLIGKNIENLCAVLRTSTIHILIVGQIDHSGK